MPVRERSFAFGTWRGGTVIPGVFGPLTTMEQMHSSKGFERRGRRTMTAVAALALLVGFATGCVGDRDPTGYSDSVKENFIEGCVATSTNAEPTSSELKDRKTYCGCIYTKMTDKKTGISFDEFSSAQKKIQKDPVDPANQIDKLLPELAKFKSACKSGPGAS